MSTPAPDWWIDALAETVYGIRLNTRGVTEGDTTRWDAPGIKTAIRKLLDTTSLPETAKVLIAGADNPRLRTPGGVTAPGPQWDDTSRATTKPPTMCPEHPGVPYTRCECQTRRVGTPKPANFAQLAAQARADAAADNPTRTEIAHRQATAWAAHEGHTA